MRPTGLLVSLLLPVLLAGCVLGPRPVHQNVIPTIGPVQHISGISTAALMYLTASTNCAEVGDSVTFTAQITNTMRLPIILIGTPPLDIVLKSGVPGILMKRWSATSQYPNPLNPTLAPNEVRTYQWRWVADAAYSPLQQTAYPGVEAQLEVGGLSVGDETIPKGSIEIYIGVGSYMLPQPGMTVHCADM